MPDRAESFREVDRSKNHPKARLGFVRPIQNELRKEQNLINSTPSRAGTGLAVERMELDSRKKSRWDRMMRSKNVETQEVKEIGWKEAGELKGFPIL